MRVQKRLVVLQAMLKAKRPWTWKDLCDRLPNVKPGTISSVLSVVSKAGLLKIVGTVHRPHSRPAVKYVATSLFTIDRATKEVQRYYQEMDTRKKAARRTQQSERMRTDGSLRIPRRQNTELDLRSPNIQDVSESLVVHAIDAVIRGFANLAILVTAARPTLIKALAQKK